MGWSPVTRSMMARRRWPSPALPRQTMPSPSGPRWAITAVMERRSAPSTGRPVTSTMPVMPHMARRALSFHPLPLMGIVDVPGGFARPGVPAVDGEAGRAAPKVVVALCPGVEDMHGDRVLTLVEEKRAEGEAQDAPLDGRGDRDHARVGQDAAQVVPVEIVDGDAEDGTGDGPGCRIRDLDGHGVLTIEAALRPLPVVRDGHIQDG